MSEIKKKDVIDLYRKLVDPLGYIISLKQGKTTQPWKPEKDTYDSMGTVELTKEIADLKIQADNLNKVTIEVREKAINYMNSRQPNTLTENLYTGQYAKNSVEKSKIQVISQTLEHVKKLLNYLETLKLVKHQQEMTEGFKTVEAGLISMEIDQGIGRPQTLKVVIK